jgi:predicted helicase
VQKDDRVKLYLTNTLEMEELAQTELPGMASLSEESHLAGKVKKEQPILVILGNPPYSVSSVNKSDFIEHEMNLYKEDVRQERNIQPLSDDYIKFIRFAHWKIAHDGKGMIGMITNNSYLSGLIHRGMRKKLLESFDEIYILNLHGNSRIGEKCPDGSKDENVFDIQQGVAVVLFVREENRGKACRVFYQDVFGLRESKYRYLSKRGIRNTKWAKLKPSAPSYFFVEKDFALQGIYDRFVPTTEVFQKFSEGIKTHRDHFVVGFTSEEIKQKMRTFTSDLPDEMVRQALGLKDTRDWKLKTAREKVKSIDWQKLMRPYSYRPFDEREIIFASDLIEFDRYEIMQHFVDKTNLALSLPRRLRDPIWQHVYVTHSITDKTLLSSRDNCYCFPLYLYEHAGKPRRSSVKTVMMLFEPKAPYSVKRPNISETLIKGLSSIFGKEPSPEQIFYYIYAVLYSEIYRAKYAEFLKIDFPRVPFTKEFKLFKKMSEFGNRLVDLHLLKSPELDSPVARFQGKGDNKIEKLDYDGKMKLLYINKAQHFEGIASEVWSYQIGGYQVCDKWLKDRKGRILSLDEIQTYCKIVTGIEKAIKIQKAIDQIYEGVEKEVIPFSGFKGHPGPE